jgi:hypothetical protein
MKLESLKNGIFAESTIKREQMFNLNGGGTKTPGGSGCGTGTSSSRMDAVLSYDYGYDIIQSDGRYTYHDRKNVREISAEECAALRGF